ncbi:MAG: hypothetical protein IJ871_05105 [Ruminococcus sp.]|nr:hypothetical protein [Ruminococcus sp.]
MSRPDLTKVRKMLEAGEEFSLTEKQYLKKTGTNIPKDGYYLTHKSAVARAAQENGYSIEVQERTILFRKVT